MAGRDYPAIIGFCNLSGYVAKWADILKRVHEQDKQGSYIFATLLITQEHGGATPLLPRDVVCLDLFVISLNVTLFADLQNC